MKIFEAIMTKIKQLKESKTDHALSNLQKNKLILVWSVIEGLFFVVILNFKH